MYLLWLSIFYIWAKSQVVFLFVALYSKCIATPGNQFKFLWSVKNIAIEQ